MTPPEVGEGEAPTADVEAVPPLRAALPRGACVGRYVILEELGSGGMGVVYKAYDPELSRPVALKLLHTSKGEQAELHRERMLREAQALARLAHPNVVNVHDVGSFEAHVFIAMEFVDGQTLRRWLAERRRSRREILETFLAAGEGLAAAHRAGLVHRDFKPDNVIVGNDGRVRVLDFGLVRAAGDGAGTPVAVLRGPLPAAPGSETVETLQVRSGALPGPRPLGPVDARPERTEPAASESTRSDRLSLPLTYAGTIMGTPRFMAPEQHLGDPADERADQFSFCVSLYWALYDALPFAGKTADEHRDAVLEGRVEPPRRGVDVPARLRAVLLRGLASSPSARWPSMAALLAELRKDPAAAWRRRAAMGAVTLAGLVALLAAGLAIRTRRLANVQAQLANEFGQEVARMSASARIAALLPLHDLGPETNEIRGRMSMIGAEMARLGAVATGPGHYALGRGHAALDQWSDALQELDAAYASGYRNPELAYSLGLAHGKLYQKALAALTQTGDAAADAARRAAIARAHRDPALRYLKEANGGDMAAPEYVQGLIALYEQRFAEALTLAQKAARRVPSLFEAHTLQGDIHLAAAKDRSLSGDVDGALAELRLAAEPYGAATELARSSAEAFAGECQRLVVVSEIEVAKSVSPEASVKAALVACDKALVARPGRPDLLLLEAKAWRQLADYQSWHSVDPTVAADHAIRLGEDALRRQPDDGSADLELCRSYAVLGAYHLHKGGDVLTPTARAVEHGKRVLARAGGSFDAHHTLALAYRAKFEYEERGSGDPRPSAEAAIEQARKSLEYAPRNHHAWNSLGNSYVTVGLWELKHGIDPTASLNRSIEAFQKVAAGAPQLDLGFVNLCYAYNILGEHLAHIDKDPLSVFEQAAANAKKAIALEPNSSIGYINLSSSYGDMARWQAAHHVDPTALLDESRASLRRALAIDAVFETYAGLADIELTAARWALAQGRDPTAAFAAATAAIRRALALSDGKDGYVLSEQADIERWRAEWLRQRGQPVDEVVRRGLDLTARALALKPDIVDAFGSEGALQLIAARAARRPADRVAAATRARAALEKATALNRFRAGEYRPLLDEAMRLAVP